MIQRLSTGKIWLCSPDIWNQTLLFFWVLQLARLFSDIYHIIYVRLSWKLRLCFIISVREQCCCVKLIFLSTWQSSLVPLSALLTHFLCILFLPRLTSEKEAMYFQSSRRRGEDGIAVVIDFLLSNARLVLGVSGAAILGIATLAVKRVSALVPAPHLCIYMDFNSLGILPNRNHAEAFFSPHINKRHPHCHKLSAGGWILSSSFEQIMVLSSNRDVTAAKHSQRILKRLCVL